MSRRASEAALGPRAEPLSGAASRVVGDWLDELERTGNRLLKSLGRRRLRTLFRQHLAGERTLLPITAPALNCSPAELEAAARGLGARMGAAVAAGEATAPVQAAAEALCGELRQAARNRDPERPAARVGQGERPTQVLREITVAIQNARTPDAVAHAVTEGALQLCQASAAVWWRRRNGRLFEAVASSGATLPQAVRSFRARGAFWQPPANGEPALNAIMPGSAEQDAWLQRVGARHAAVIHVPEAGSWSGLVTVHDGTCDPDRLDLLLAVVEQARAALREAEPEEARPPEMAKAASELGLALTAAVSLDDLLGRVCQVVTETTAAAKCFLFLAEEEGQLILRGRAGASLEETRRLHDELARLAQRARDEETGGPVVEEGGTASGELAATRRRGFRSVLAAPLSAHARRLGAIVALARQPHAFDLFQQEGLLSLASQAAAEIENMQLLESAQRHLTEISHLTWTGSRVSSTLDPESIAQTVAQSAAGTLRVPRVALFLADAEGEFGPLRRGQIGFSRVRSEALPAFGHLGSEALAGPSVLTVPDAAASGRAGDLLVLWMGARSLACAPMAAPQGLRGLFVVADDVPRTFDLHETSLLSTYANQAALALQGALLYRHAVQEVSRLTKLGEASEALAAAKTPSQSADILLRSGIELFEAQVGVVYVVDPDTQELALSATSGVDPEQWPFDRVRPGESLPGLAAETGRVLVSVDVTRDGRVRHRQMARELGLGAGIAAPLISQGRVTGVLTLYRRSTARFSEEDQRLLVSLAANAATAIENANLTRESQRRSEFISAMMSEVNHRMRNSLQMIIGLLRMETERPGGRSPEEVVRRAISHIQAVAAVQDAIREPEVYLVDMKEVALRVASLHRGLRERHIDVHVGGTRVMLPSQRAIHVALVLDELTDNAIRHGFAGAEGGRISISLAEGGGEVIVQVRDTGVGAPKGFDPEAGPGLGLKIVRGLVEQELGGRVELESKNGFTVRARFPKLE